MSEENSKKEESASAAGDVGADMKQKLNEWRAKKKDSSHSPEHEATAPASTKSPRSLSPPAKSVAEVLAASSLEFRDALQNIQGFLEVLLSGKVTDERQAFQFLGIAHRESQYLSHRVSDLLTASLIETDKLRLKLTALGMAQMIKSIVEEGTPTAGDKGIHIKVMIPPDLTSIQGDETLLSQALTNLMDATIKHTPREGHIVIRTSLKNDGLLIQIAGVPRREGYDPSAPIEMDGAKSASVGDLGLGLYVAEQIVKEHDGSVSIHTVQDGPIVFTVHLRTQPRTRKRGRILIVEDNPDLALLMYFALEKEGFQTFKAANGLEALEIVKAEKIELLVLDVMLPGIDGFEVCHRLRSSPDTASVRVIMISAKAREEDRSTALRAGADAYFRKPLGMNDLIDAIEELLEDGKIKQGRGSDVNSSPN